MKSILLTTLTLVAATALRLTAADAPINTLTAAEKAAGWKLLFNGQSLDGWSNFKKQTIKPGWQVTNSALVCVDPHNAPQAFPYLR